MKIKEKEFKKLKIDKRGVKKKEKDYSLDQNAVSVANGAISGLEVTGDVDDSVALPLDHRVVLNDHHRGVLAVLQKEIEENNDQVLY